MKERGEKMKKVIGYSFLAGMVIMLSLPILLMGVGAILTILLPALAILAVVGMMVFGVPLMLVVGIPLMLVYGVFGTNVGNLLVAGLVMFFVASYITKRVKKK